MSAKKVVKFASYATTPEVGRPAFLNGVKGHYRLGNEETVQTSFVVDIGDEGRLIETKNTIYVMED